MASVIQNLDYDSQRRRDVLTLIKSAFWWVRFGLLGCSLGVGILAAALAVIAFATRQRIAICNGWEVSSHWGGVSVWRKIDLSLNDHRFIFYVYNERNEDAAGRAIRTNAFQRRPIL